MTSIWAKAALIVLLVFSLGLKARSIDRVEQPIEQPSAPALFSALSADGFTLTEAAGLEGPAWVAARGGCHIEVATISPLGWHQSAMSVRAGAQALAYVYAGQIYQEQPVLLSKLGYYWHKLTNYFYPSMQPPVFGVVTSDACAGQSVDITSIARLLPG